MAAAAKYAQEDGGEERPMRVCAEAGRKCVRNIQQYPVLSVEWIALVDSLKQLGRLVHLEGRMPNNAKVSEMQGRNQDSDGTLWDQEGHENAIRILVEEAKVNLCLRMMADYKEWQYDPVRKQNTMQDAMRSYEYSETQLEQKCRSFEESLGTLLCKAFQHAETLQLMDIPMLINHIYAILTRCNATPRGADDAPLASKLQENLVTFYFSSLMKHAEKLNNGELLANTRECNLVAMLTRHLLTTTSESQIDVAVAAAEGFAALADNEDFSPVWQSFFPDENAKAEFMQLELKILGPVLADNPDKRKDLRPLIDFFNKMKRG